MIDDFCVFILTHGRPDRVYTYNTLLKAGYSGKIYIVIDDNDKTRNEYYKRYGNNVLEFSKEEIVKTFDEGDNFYDRRAIIYARNACWDLAQQVGCKYFIQLDDDYTHFNIRYRSNGSPCNGMIRNKFDDLIEALVDFYSKIPALSIAMAQGGDYIGGATPDKRKLTRKAMNTFICSIDRRFNFFGRINEDVNTYTLLGLRGYLFFTVMQSFVNQEVTQKTSGGMTDMYVDSGTYIKSFYSVMYCPSSVKIGVLGDNRSPHYRIHHTINWNVAVPKIIREEHRKP